MAKVKDGLVEEEVIKAGQAVAAVVMLATTVATMRIMISAAWDGMTSRALQFKYTLFFFSLSSNFSFVVLTYGLIVHKQK